MLLSGDQVRREFVVMPEGARHHRPHPPAPAAPAAPSAPAPAPAAGAAFFDDFTGDAGSLPSASSWVISGVPFTDDPTDGSANYTDSTANVYVDGNSHLIIAVTAASGASRVTPARGAYNSARIATFDSMNGGNAKFAQSWGTFSASIKVTPAQGFWPAFWMTGTNITTWPYCGECDILENYGTSAELYASYSTVHGPMSNGGDYGYSLSSTPSSIETGFHTYAMVIPEDYSQVSFSYDGAVYETVTQAEWEAAAGSGSEWVYGLDTPLGFILNVDVGSNVDPADVGFPAAGQVLPAVVLEVDWVQATQP